jgi:hypothetical protein
METAGETTLGDHDENMSHKHPFLPPLLLQSDEGKFVNFRRSEVESIPPQNAVLFRFLPP